jgi:histidinol-phosphate aminotransferase
MTWVSLASTTMNVVAPRPDVQMMDGYHSPQVDVAVRLNTNESPFAPPAAWADAFAAEMSRVVWNRYPDRQARALREAIAEVHGVDRAQVFAANGSNEVLQTLLLTYAGAGRTVLTFEPTYQLHAHIARLTGATVVEGERGDDFRLDLPEALRLLGEVRPTVTFLCSPNNPTGLEEPPEHLDALLAATTGLVVVDEAYGQFSSWSAVPLVDDELPLVVTRTFSKTWSMAATRLGYLIGPRWLVADLEKVTLPYHLDAGKQIAGRVALRFADEMEGRVETIVAERRRISAELDVLDVDVFPSGANFVLFRTRSQPADDVWNALVDRGVLVRNCSGWPRLANCLRVTVGTPAENDAFLAALTHVLSGEPK